MAVCVRTLVREPVSLPDFSGPPEGLEIVHSLGLWPAVRRPV